MYFEAFAQGNSPIHKLDPRVRLICAAVLVSTFALVQNAWAALGGLCLSVALVLIASFSLKQLSRHLAALNLFLVPVWILLPFSMPGNSIFQVEALTPVWQGVFLALLITLKSNAIILTSLALLCSMRAITLVRALESLYFPAKLCQMLFFSLRYFQVIHSEYRRLHDAMLVRAFTPRTNLHTCKIYGYLVSMLLVRSLNRGQRVYEAMLCRGFAGHFYRLQYPRMNKSDKLFLAMGLLVVIFTWVLDQLIFLS